MAKIFKIEPVVKPKNLPPWKNRVVIDAVKADIVEAHNRKIGERKRGE